MAGRKRNPHLRINAAVLGGACIAGLAAALDVSPAVALRHWLHTLLGFALHQPDGDATQRTGAVIAEWALWTGDPLRYSDAFRSTCAPTGTIENWSLIGGDARAKVAKREKENAEPQANLYAPFFDAWREAYGGLMPAGKNVGHLKDLFATHGAEEVLTRFKRMLAQEQAKFAGAHLLRSGWNSYDEATPNASRRRSRAAAFHKLLVDTGILSRADMLERIDGLVLAGKVRDKEKFLGALRSLDRDLVRDARNADYAIRHIEDRLGSYLDG